MLILKYTFADNWFEDKGIVLYLPILAISDVMLLCGAIWRLRCPIILWFFPNAVAFLFIIIDLAEDSPSFSHVWVFRSLEIIVLLFYCYTILVVLSYLFKFQSRSGQVLRQGPEQVNLEDPPPPYSPREYEPQTPTAPAI